MFCTNCGKQLEDGDRFCGNCGTPVENPTEISPVIPVVEIVEPVETVEPAKIDFEGIDQNLNQQPEMNKAAAPQASPAPSYQQPTATIQPAPQKSKKKKVLIIVIIAAVVFIGICIGVFVGVKKFINKVVDQIEIETVSDEEYIDIVKKGFLPGYNTYTVGDVFDGFFFSSEWKYFQASDGDHVVQFEGDCFSDDVLIDVLVQFIVKGDDFELYALEVDGEVQDDAMTTDILDQIYTQASQYGLEEHEPTSGSAKSSNQQEALDAAKSYIEYMGMSRDELIEQLEWEGFTTEAATYAADNCGADWYEEAEQSAADYLKYLGMSYTGLLDQLEYDGFTPDQAKKAVEACNPDWNEQAAKCAQGYLDIDLSKEEIYDMLQYEGFTEEQIQYGMNAIGY